MAERGKAYEGMSPSEPSASGAGRRVALVIGNAAYPAAPLRNPRNDAEAFATKLKEVHPAFDVTLALDVGRDAMEDALEAFETRLANCDTGLLFFAGHGLQVKGVNFLMPVDADIRQEIHLRRRAFALDEVLDIMGRRVRSSLLVFLDACRDNPFARSLLAGLSDHERGRFLTRSGLAEVRAGAGSFVAFATAPDNVALDGAGANSPFTTAIVKHMATPNASINDVMIAVRQDVLKATGGRQEPWDQSSLRERFTFHIVSEPVAPSPPESILSESAIFEKAALEHWEAVKGTKDPARLRAFLADYGTSRMGLLAREALQRLASDAWREVSPDDEVALQRFIDEFPGTHEVSEASARLAQLQVDREATESEWNAVKDTSDPAQLVAFLASHATSPLTEQAREALQRLASAAWREVSPDHEASLKRFIDAFPDTDEVAEAGARLARLQADRKAAEEHWEVIKDTIDPAQLLAFLTDHGTGPLAQPTREALQRLASVAWRRIAPDDAVALARFIEEYPGTSQLPEASALLAKLQADHAAAEAQWEAVKDAGDTARLRAFLSEHGTSPWAPLAQEALHWRATVAWQKVSLDDEAAIKRFIDAFPGSKEASWANAELIKLQRRRWWQERLSTLVRPGLVAMVAIALGLAYWQSWRLEPRREEQVRIASDSLVGPTPSPIVQRAILVEEATGSRTGKRFAGSVTWKAVSDNPGPPAVTRARADVELPDLQMRVTWSLQRNHDRTLPASHIVETTFANPDSFPHGRIASVGVPQMRDADATSGVALSGIPAKVTAGFFLTALTEAKSDMDRNLQLLRDLSWLDIPIVYEDGQRAVLSIEKGDHGQSVLRSALLDQPRWRVLPKEEIPDVPSKPSERGQLRIPTPVLPPSNPAPSATEAPQATSKSSNEPPISRGLYRARCGTIEINVAGSGLRCLDPADLVKREFEDCFDLKGKRVCGPRMVVVPFGKFLMGTSDTEVRTVIDQGGQANSVMIRSEAPEREVSIPRPFAVGVTHVTRREFADFVAATGRVTKGGCWSSDVKRDWRAPGFPQDDNHPVVCVSWLDAQAYVTWLKDRTGMSYRLMTEAEAEYVTRATTAPVRQPTYFFGEAPQDLCRFGNVGDRTFATVPGKISTVPCTDGFIYTAPAGSFAANPFGVKDVYGNALTWTQDCFVESSEQAPIDGSHSVGTGDCTRGVTRGSSWGHHAPHVLRSAFRSTAERASVSASLGFRVARTLDPGR